MFDLRKALLPLNGYSYSGWDVIKFDLADVIWNNRKNLGPGFNANDLFTLAVDRGYIKQYPDGSIKVDLT